MRRPFIDILDECIDLVLLHGEPVEACVARYPQFADELREALESALAVRQAFSFQPEPQRKRDARLRLLEALERGRTSRRWLRGWVEGLAMGGRRWAVTATALVLALVVGSTTTVLAASDAIPGDTLYPAKRVGERARLMFAFTDTREAGIRTDLMTRRVGEMETLINRGRTQFLPRLVHEIERHSEKARVLTELSLGGEMAAAQAAVHAASKKAVSRNGEDATRVVAVKADPLLIAHDRFLIAEGRLKQLSERAGSPSTQRMLQDVAESLSFHRVHTSRTLEQVDAIRLAFGEAREEESADAPKDKETLGPWQEISARVVAVQLVVDRGNPRLDLIVELPNGKHQRVYLSPAAAQFHKGNRPGRLNDLRIGSEVVMTAHAVTGVIRGVRVMP